MWRCRSAMRAAAQDGHAAFSTLPTVDVAGPSSRPSGGRARVAAEIGAATRAAGFFYVTGHGVPRDLIDPLVERTRAFFAQPIAYKMAHYIGLSPNHRGYVPEGEEVFYGGTHDRKEA